MLAVRELVHGIPAATGPLFVAQGLASPPRAGKRGVLACPPRAAEPASAGTPLLALHA